MSFLNRVQRGPEGWGGDGPLPLEFAISNFSVTWALNGIELVPRLLNKQRLY